MAGSGGPGLLRREAESPNQPGGWGLTAHHLPACWNPGQHGAGPLKIEPGIQSCPPLKAERPGFLAVVSTAVLCFCLLGPAGRGFASGYVGGQQA